MSAVLDYSSGDVIWKNRVDSRLNPAWGAYKASNMRPVALVAAQGTKDLWAAFIRSMGAPMNQRAAVARAEANILVAHWLSYDEKEMLTWYDDVRPIATRPTSGPQGQTGKGKIQAQCMAGLDVGTTDQHDPRPPTGGGPSV
jgi:hypothetical protein